MENPATWGPAEKVIAAAVEDFFAGKRRGVYGLSMTRVIADALRDAGLLSDPDAGDRIMAVLRRNVGRWVAVKGPELLFAGGSVGEVIDFLRAHNLRADSVFRVPRDPGGEIAGER